MSDEVGVQSDSVLHICFIYVNIFPLRTYAVRSFVAQTFQFVSEKRVCFWENSHLTGRAMATIA